MGGHNPQDLVHLHCRLGETLAWWGWFGGAAQAFRDALSIDPRRPHVHYRLGETLAQSRRWLEAAAAFEGAARLEPSDIDAQGNVVLSLARAGFWDGAVDALRRFIHLRPHDAEAHILLGVVLRRLRRNVEAIRVFRVAARLDAAPPESRFLLGEALLGPKAWEEARRMHQAASDLLPPAVVTGEPGHSLLNRPPGRRESPFHLVADAPRVLARLRAAMSEYLGATRSGLAASRRMFSRTLGNGLGWTLLRLGYWFSTRRPHVAIWSFRMAADLRPQSVVAVRRVPGRREQGRAVSSTPPRIRPRATTRVALQCAKAGGSGTA